VSFRINFREIQPFRAVRSARFVSGANRSGIEAMRMRDKKLRVLLAEGSSGEAAGALCTLFPERRENLELTVVSTISTLIATIEVVRPEIILLDLVLAQPDPIGTVRLVHRASPTVPLIVIADEATKDQAAKCLRQGALDCLLKECLDPGTLERVFRAALEHNTLDGLADLLRDSITGMYIRDGLLALGARAMEIAKRNGSTLVLLCLRIGNLPAVRVAFGPSVEESLLREVASLLAGSFRKTDFVARLGASQFAALAVNAIEPSGPVLCQRVERRITVLNRDLGTRGPVEVRLNVGFWSGADTRSFPELLDSVESGLRAPPVPAFATDSSGVIA
jgi:diguanylate cyclase (GGDEF)-like protein